MWRNFYENNRDVLIDRSYFNPSSGQGDCPRNSSEHLTELSKDFPASYVQELLKYSFPYSPSCRELLQLDQLCGVQKKSAGEVQCGT